MSSEGQKIAVAIDDAVHSAACFACRNISGLQYDTAVSIVTGIPKLKQVGNERFLQYVKDAFWSSPEWRKLLEKQSGADRSEPQRSNSAYMSRAARESRRFTWMKNNRADEQPTETARSGAGRGDRIGDPCMFRMIRDAKAKRDVMQPGWLRQWSTQDIDGHAYPVAIVEHRETGECFCAWVEDLKFV